MPRPLPPPVETSVAGEEDPGAALDDGTAAPLPPLPPTPPEPPPPTPPQAPAEAR